jgi:hypothetical protein
MHGYVTIPHHALYHLNLVSDAGSTEAYHSLVSVGRKCPWSFQIITSTSERGFLSQGTLSNRNVD